mgnify:CR=1 FL=1
MSNTLVEDPLGEVARRQLQIIFMVDTSGSMTGERIQMVNQAYKIFFLQITP